jgi:replication-associated recombination protein RarA
MVSGTYLEQKTLLFIDEIDRDNKAEQDLLLSDVENTNIL